MEVKGVGGKLSTGMSHRSPRLCSINYMELYGRISIQQFVVTKRYLCTPSEKAFDVVAIQQRDCCH
jgi:hypothetical protein